MKKLILIVGLFIFSSVYQLSFAASLDSLLAIRAELTHKFDSLTRLIDDIRIQRESINDELKKMTILIDQDLKNQRTDTESFMGEVRIILSIGRFKETPESSFRSTTLEELKRGDKVLLLGLHDESYFKAQYLGRDGYIHRRYFDEDNEEYRDYYISQLKHVNPKLGNLVERYGLQDGRRIDNGRYWLGMTKEMARASLGAPDNINRSAHVGGVRREQWVYRTSGLYLYFDGNALSSFQKRD